MKTGKVIIVGAGLAGLCAAIEAAQQGMRVTVLEKSAAPGGNSAKATSGINGAGTRMQAKQGIEDSPARLLNDTLRSGAGGVCRPVLLQQLAQDSAAAVHWLVQLTGLELSLLCQLGGHGVPRTHRLPAGADAAPRAVGAELMQALQAFIARDFAGRINIVSNTRVIRLLTAPPLPQPAAYAPLTVRVTGVECSSPDASGQRTVREVHANAVILATGGYSGDQGNDSLLRAYTPECVSLPTTNGDFATGDGIRLGQAVGALLLDMDKVQLHPTGLINPADPAALSKFLGPESLRGCGGLLLDPQGRRFTDELGLRSAVTAAIRGLGNAYPDSNGLPFAYCVLNRPAAESFGRAQLDFYRDQAGLLRRANTLEELAGLIGVRHADELRRTFAEYAEALHQGRCEATGKTVFPCAWAADGSDGPYDVAVVTPCIHYTMGGLAIAATAAVLQDPGAPTQALDEAQLAALPCIPGLYAAGEVTAGIHGANRLGGNSLLDCVVFGRRAGASAAQA